jgi:predicted anti-sigma-YlaC factor YlaD
MISCAEFMAELGSYLEGEVALLVRAQIENHLAHCQTCRIIYDSSRKTLQIVTDSDCFELPETALQSVTEQIMARIRAEATNE